MNGFIFIILLIVILFITNGITRLFAVFAFIIIWRLQSDKFEIKSPGLLFSNNLNFETDKVNLINNVVEPSILECPCNKTCSDCLQAYELIDFNNYETDLNTKIAKKNIQTGEKSRIINRGMQKSKVDYLRPMFQEAFEYYEDVDWWNNN